MHILIYLKELFRGKDLYRILMNSECANYQLRGLVLDLGSGLNAASYHRFLGRAVGAEVISLDLAIKDGPAGQIDLEKDRLPYADSSIDTVLIFNLLEHLFNYSHLLVEIRRVLKSGGQVIGAVPFLVGYHADPHDFWRYTSESLKKIFSAADFPNINIKVLGRGPWSAAFSQIEFLLPRLTKMVILPLVFFLDSLLLKLKPNLNPQKFALGLFFSLSK